MYTPDPGSWFLPIPDPGSKNSKKKREGWKKFVIPFYVATNFTKLKIILVLKCWRKKNLGQFSMNYRTFYPKNCHEALKNMALGSEIRDPKKTYPGSRGQKGTGSRIRIRNTEKWKTSWSASLRQVNIFPLILKFYFSIFRGWLLLTPSLFYFASVP